MRSELSRTVWISTLHFERCLPQVCGSKEASSSLRKIFTSFLVFHVPRNWKLEQSDNLEGQQIELEIVLERRKKYFLLRIANLWKACCATVTGTVLAEFQPIVGPTRASNLPGLARILNYNCAPHSMCMQSQLLRTFERSFKIEWIQKRYPPPPFLRSNNN